MSSRITFTLGSAAALAGLVAACVGGPGTAIDPPPPGTSSGVPPTQTTPPSGVTDGGFGKKDAKVPTIPPIEEDASEDTCKVNATFAAPVINPPATPVNACSTVSINALADACAQDPGGKTTTTCATSRALAANKTCADCIFGTKTDIKWKAINIDGTDASFNQAGCIDHITAVPGCGGAYVTILRCANTYCPQAPAGTCDQTTGTACFNEIKTGECKQYLLGNDVSSDDQACSNALQAKDPQISDACFAQDNTAAAVKSFFINIAETFCQK